MIFSIRSLESLAIISLAFCSLHWREIYKATPAPVKVAIAPAILPIAPPIPITNVHPLPL